MIERSKASVMMMSEAHNLYILHARKYRDTSLLAEVFSLQEGRYSLVFRGARSAKSKTQGLLQPFYPLLVNSYGKGELRTAGTVDTAMRAWQLTGENLLIGLYVNELLYRVMHRFEPIAQLYNHYERLLAALEHPAFNHSMLREFELALLANLGYAISFDYDTRTGATITAGQRYRFIVEQGFYSLPANDTEQHSFSGEHLLAISQGECSEITDKLMKTVIRLSLQPLLGDKPLKSRSLFERRLR